MIEYLLAILMSAFPYLIGMVVAVVVIKGPARWTAVAGLVLQVIVSAVAALFPVVLQATSLSLPVGVVFLNIVGLVGWTLIALSVVHAAVWARRANPPAPVASWGAPGQRGPAPGQLR